MAPRKVQGNREVIIFGCISYLLSFSTFFPAFPFILSSPEYVQGVYVGSWVIQNDVPVSKVNTKTYCWLKYETTTRTCHTTDGPVSLQSVIKYTYF